MFKRKLFCISAASVFGFMLTSQVFCQEPDAKLSIGGVEGKIGLEMKTEFDYYDDGLKESKDTTKVKTGSINLVTLRPILTGKLGPEVSYKFRYNLVTPGIDYAFGQWQPISMISIGVGKWRVNQAGWERKVPSLKQMATGIYAGSMQPFDTYVPMIELSAALAGNLSLQLVNDVAPKPTTTTATTTTENYYGTMDKLYWNQKSKQPAVVLEWMGEFGPISPLVQLSSYDLNHSMYALGGLKAKIEGLEATVDYAQDLRSAKFKDPKDAEKNKDVKGTITSYTLTAAYTVPSIIRPQILFSGFDYKQPDNKDVGAYDWKGNPDTSTWTDNGMTWAVSANYLGIKGFWEPYLAVAGRSGKIVKDKTILVKDAKTESKSDMHIKIGILGGF